MMLRFLDQKDILELKQKTVLNNCDVHDVGYIGMIIMMYKNDFSWDNWLKKSHYHLVFDNQFWFNAQSHINKYGLNQSQIFTQLILISHFSFQSKLISENPHISVSIK